MRPTKPLIPLQAVAAALGRSMPEPVLARNGQKRMMLMILTTCVQQHGFCAAKMDGSLSLFLERIYSAMFQPVIVPVEMYRLPAGRAWIGNTAVRRD